MIPVRKSLRLLTVIAIQFTLTTTQPSSAKSSGTHRLTVHLPAFCNVLVKPSITFLWVEMHNQMKVITHDGKGINCDCEVLS